MTQPPGPPPHHDGDGCTGQPRVIDTDAADTISHRAKRLLVRADEGAWPKAAIHADWPALHYGPPGAFLLAAALGSYALQGPGTPPQLAYTVPDGDLEAAALLEHLAHHNRLAGSPLEQCGALTAVRLPLQTFLLHLHVMDTAAARRQWLHVHTHGAADPLIPPAFTTLLTLWAARTTFTTPHPSAQTAPLN